MSLLQLPKIIREAICAHEAFRRMGFTADKIYIGIANDLLFGGRPTLGVVVKHGGKEFRFSVGICKMSDAELADAWKQAAATFNAGPPEATHLWETSQVKRELTDLVLAVQAKGLLGANLKPVS